MSHSTGRIGGNTGLPNGLWAFIACLLRSTAFVGVKAGYEAGAAPLFFAGLRFFISGVVLLPAGLLIEDISSLKPAAPGFLLILSRLVMVSSAGVSLWFWLPGVLWEI